jgi:hypothetical protein
MDQHFTSLNPPSANEAPNENQSKQFLNLLKSLERARKDDQDSYELESTVLDILSNMITRYQIRGLFTSEEARAKHTPAPGNGAGTGTGKKRKRGGASGSSGKISSILSLDGNNTSEEAYVLSNLSRVLIPCSESGLIYPPSVVASATIAMDAICQHCIHSSQDKFMVEQEMIGSIASQLISGLSKTMKHLVGMVEVDEALVACCNCAKSIIILSNLKLSRNGSVVTAIHNVAKEILVCDEGGSVEVSGVVEAAASLIASIPLVGNSNGAPPMKLWSEMVLQQTGELASTLQAFFPLVKKLKRGKSSKGDDDLEWIRDVRNTITSQASRLVLFFARAKGLVAVLTKLMEMDGYHMSNVADGAALPITALLDVSEQMLLFSSIAETRFLATKSRLRDVSIEGGLLSPNAAVTIGNSMKHLGYALFESVILSLGTTALQYGKRLITIALTSLQSCSTLTLKRVIDSSSSADKNSRKKWLHSSVHLRTRSIEIFTIVAQRLGPNVAVTQNDHVSKALAFVAGCLLEQMTTNEQVNGIQDEHWGSEGERAKLVVVCFEALSASLDIFGGFLTMQNRELIESMALTCLGNIGINSSPGRFCNFAPVKATVLKLGVSCITNPWPDGASSGLVQALRRAAFVLRFDGDSIVSAAAYSAMSICNMAVMPRAPPLMIVSRSNDVDGGMMNTNQFFSRESLEGGIGAVREDILKSKIIEKEIQEKKKNAKKAKEEMMAKSKSMKHEESTNKLQQGLETKEIIEVKQTIELSTEAECDDKEEQKNRKEVEKPPGSINSTPNEEKPMEVDIEDEVSVGEKEHVNSSDSDEDEEGSDDDFPPIIDCAPDDEDM